MLVLLPVTLVLLVWSMIALHGTHFEQFSDCPGDVAFLIITSCVFTCLTVLWFILSSVYSSYYPVWKYEVNGQMVWAMMRRKNKKLSLYEIYNDSVKKYCNFGLYDFRPLPWKDGCIEEFRGSFRSWQSDHFTTKVKDREFRVGFEFVFTVTDDMAALRDYLNSDAVNGEYMDVWASALQTLCTVHLVPKYDPHSVYESFMLMESAFVNLPNETISAVEKLSRYMLLEDMVLVVSEKRGEEEVVILRESVRACHD
jgi:hypothetical protein